MNFLAIFLRGTTALVLTIATVETIGPALDSRERFARARSQDETPCSTRGAFHSLEGHVLVATEAMPDPTFAGSVVYLLHHDGDGAVGIVLTRPLAARFGSLALHDGGPVGDESLFLLHSTDYLLPTSKMLEAGLALTSDPRALDAIRDGKGPKRAILAWGYSGWGPSQLESEIAQGAWRTEDADDDRVLSFASRAP